MNELFGIVVLFCGGRGDMKRKIVLRPHLNKFSTGVRCNVSLLLYFAHIDMAQCARQDNTAMLPPVFGYFLTSLSHVASRPTSFGSFGGQQLL